MTKKTFILKIYSLIFILSANYITTNDDIITSDAVETVDIITPKSALIFGITGQDGAYLTKFLLHKGYKVYGVVRRSSNSNNTERLNHILQKEDENIKKNLVLLYGDITDCAAVFKIINTTKPDEIYNLAAQSHVKISFEKPNYTAQVDAIGTLNILEAIKSADLTKKTKLYQASTSELFGIAKEIPQTERTPFYPRSPYGVAKLYAYWICVNYREAYKIFACNGILFNHESPYRGENFVTRIISKDIAKIKLGLQDNLTIGNLNSKRDWGFAGDYVEAMWLILQQEKPDDFVIATGETHSVREFIELAFEQIGINIQWQGEGVNEIGVDKKTGKVLVKIDPKYFRPTEVDLLIGDANKAKNKLGWQPKVTFKELIKIMVEADIKFLQKN